jgi:hypothetical protein
LILIVTNGRDQGIEWCGHYREAASGSAGLQQAFPKFSDLDAMSEQNPYTPPTVARNDDSYDQPADADYGWDVARAQKALLLAVLLEFAGMTPRFGPILYLLGVGLSFCDPVLEGGGVLGRPVWRPQKAP